MSKRIVKSIFIGTVFTVLFLGLLFSSMKSEVDTKNDRIAISNAIDTPIETSVTSKAPSLIFSQVFEINDDHIGDSDGDADNLADAGETIELRLQLENAGDQGVTNVYANLTSSNSTVSISNSNQTYIQIAAGETGISTSYYIIEFDSKLNVSDILHFDLEITATEGTWFDSFTMAIAGVPNPVYFGHIVYSESNGDLNADDDDIIDPGEIVQFQLYFENQGDAIMFNVYGYLASADPFVTITDGYALFGTVDSGGDMEYGYFTLDISGACPIQHTISFELSLKDKFSNWWNSTVEIVVSGTPEYELLDITFQEYDGDGDAFMDAGEAWSTTMTIRNIGDAIGNAVDVFLDSIEPFVEFHYVEDHNVSFSQIEAGFSDSRASTYDWRFYISDRAAEDQIFDFYIAVTDDSDQPATIFNTTAQVVGVADYDMLDFEIIEDCYYEEDCNGIIDAGDTYVVNITFANIGEATGNEIEVYLYSGDKYIDFYYGNGSYYDFDDLEAGYYTWYYGYYDWEFTISERARAGRIINFTIVIKDASLREWHFDASITVEDGPNTFYHTLWGKVMIFGGSIAFIAFCVVPVVRKRVKATNPGPTLGDKFKGWRKEQKSKMSEGRKQRNKERAQKNKEREAIRQERERERIARINANEKKLLEKFESILEMSESVNITQVAKSLALSESQLFEKLIQWQDMLPFKIDGNLIEVDDSENLTQSIREKIAEMSKYYSCYQCGFPIERTSETCPDCRSDILFCSVCKLPISFGDDIGSCALCEAQGHLSHMQEWLKTQGKCPVCLQPLPVEGLLQKGSKEKKK